MDELDRFAPELHGPAAMPSGVRIRFRTDSSIVAGVVEPDEQAQTTSPVDLVVDGELHDSADVRTDGAFAFAHLPAGDKDLEMWLPQFGGFRLVSIQLSAGATLQTALPDEHAPHLITYGSSITQCRQAASPTRTWPATVARNAGLHLTSLGFAGQCHLDPQVAGLIRDLPADIIIACVGINVYGQGTFNHRSFRPAIGGFLGTVRSGHPRIPIAVMTPIYSSARETVRGAAGMTLAEIRSEVAQAVDRGRRGGDSDLHLINGLDVFGPDDREHLADGIHPNDTGYQIMAQRIGEFIDQSWRREAR